jgi:hypothetical protein
MNAKYADIEEIECTYTTHFSVKIDELENAHLFREGKVKWFSIKYAHLYIDTTDGEEVEEYLGESEMAHDNIDFKWPHSTMVRVQDEWMEEKEYDNKFVIGDDEE